MSKGDGVGWCQRESPEKVGVIWKNQLKSINLQPKCAQVSEVLGQSLRLFRMSS